MLRMVLRKTAGSRTPGTPHLRVKLGIREILLNGYDAVRRGRTICTGCAELFEEKPKVKA